MRVIGLDYGTKTVGVAVSDELMLTAQPYETIERKSPGKLRQTLAEIERIITEYLKPIYGFALKRCANLQDVLYWDIPRT